MSATIAPRATVDSVADAVIGWRRYLHQHPELSFHEERTSGFVADTLREFGGLAISRPTPTSVVARLITGRKGPTLAIRADMDALPIQEKNTHAFVSLSDGVMHACGHDGHTAMLLGAVKVLIDQRDDLSGEVRFIFQHAEEVAPGGAEELVRTGVMDGVDLVIGAHLWLPMPVGQVGVKDGPLMAAPDRFVITIRGRGGHAAQPNLTVDPVVVAAEVVINLQHIVSRNVDPFAPVVLSVTRIQGGTTNNVIPESVEMEGTVRTVDSALRTEVPALMRRVLQGVTAAHGASFTLVYEEGYRPVINDAAASALLRRAVVRALGSAVLVDAAPTMGAEDFSAYQQRAPGSFFFIGARDEASGKSFPHHHERFDLDERALDHGTRIFVAAAQEFLGNGKRA
jgi:amidohydrolase